MQTAKFIGLVVAGFIGLLALLVVVTLGMTFLAALLFVALLTIVVAMGLTMALNIFRLVRKALCKDGDHPLWDKDGYTFGDGLLLLLYCFILMRVRLFYRHSQTFDIELLDGIKLNPEMKEWLDANTQGYVHFNVKWPTEVHFKRENDAALFRMRFG